MAEITVSRDIAASPQDLWEMISDVTRMGDWSPEASGGKWTKGAGPAVGARFKGTNERDGRTWSTTCTVTECVPGEVFTFDVTVGPLKISRWSFRFVPIESGCRVEETWTDQRGRFVSAIGKKTTGVTDRIAHNRANIEATLEGLDRVVTA